MTDPSPSPPATVDTVASGLDGLLTGGRGGPLRALPGTSGLRMAAALVSRPLTVALRGAGLAGELARIGIGHARVGPGPDVEHATGPASKQNPLLRRLTQVHAAASATADSLVTDAALDPADDGRVRAAVANLTAALAPGNVSLHPAAVRAAIATGAASAVRGAQRLVADPAGSPPAASAPDAFRVGAEVGATSGAVVLRTPLFELIQYLPRTERVHEVPLLIVPPVLNRYYLADLAPGRSIVEHLVRAGVQVFALSWRNPGPGDAHWDLDTYARAVLDGMDAVEHIARTDRSSLMGFGAGGTITAMLLAHLAAAGAQHRVAAVTLAGTGFDGRPAAPDAAVARASVAESAEVGHVDGRPLLAELLTRERSHQGGTPPPAAEVLFWLSDTARAPAGLHRDLVDVALRAPLSVPGAAMLLDTPLDLAKVDRDCYLVAGAADTVTAWRDAYATTALLGGTCRFVLAAGGHAGSLVSPPGGPDTRYRAGAVTGDAARWLRAGTEQPGSWWADHLDWLAARSGPRRDAPPELGGRGLHAILPAPGSYVQQ